MVFYGEREPSLQMSLEELLPESPGLPVAESGPGGALVTAPLEEALSRERRPVFACGPWPMLSAVARLAERFGAPFFASLEARMACGLGACLSCAAPLKGGGSLRVCKEGPVADGRLIDWEAFP
jgi:dihydroorotate dehydrogenase electron transfer subunit